MRNSLWTRSGSSICVRGSWCDVVDVRSNQASQLTRYARS